MTREEAIDFLIAGYPDSCYKELREAFDMAIEALKEPEREKGKWEYDNKLVLFRCSICGRYAVFYPYCPYCGAKMEVEL